MPIYTNPIYVNVRRRHFTTRAAMKSDMSGRLQEWGYVENDDYLGVLRSDGTTWRWFSRSKLFEPGTETTERVTAGINDVVINEPGADVNFRVESDTHENALYMDGQYGNWGFHTATLQNWDVDNYHSVKLGDNAFSPTWFSGNDQSGMTWNAYYDETNTRWEYISADEATLLFCDNRFFRIYSAAAGAAANDPITWIDCIRVENAAVVINDGQVDLDFRVETDNEAYTLFIEGSTDNIGMGTANPLDDLTGTAAFNIANAHGLHLLSDDDEECVLIVEGWQIPDGNGPGGRIFVINRDGVADQRCVSQETWNNSLYKFRSWDDDGTIEYDDILVFDLAAANIGIGTTTFQAACVRNLAIKEGTAPGGATADQGYIWAQDDGGTAELYVQDGAGNQLKISPHNENGEWVFDSKNIATGRRVYVEMEKFIKDYDKRFGTNFYKETL